MADELTWKDMEVGNIVQSRGAPAFAKLETGGRRGLYWTRKNATNAAYAGSIVPNQLLSFLRMDIMKLTSSTVKAVAFAPKCVPERL